MSKKSMADRTKSEGQIPLCREPWENYYILRRGIIPCCYGFPLGSSMADWATAWNSPALQEIRRHLSQGKLSPYCLECLGCPIVQRQLSKKRMESPSFKYLQKRPPLLRFLNKLMFRIPGKLWQRTLSRRNK